MPRAEGVSGAHSVSPQNLGNGGDFLAGVLVSFVKLMAYGDIGVGLSFIPGVCSAAAAARCSA
jgi:hypothetical protein